MARLRKDAFKKTTKERNSIHGTVSATYIVFEAEGKTFFQIDTYGSSKREIPGKTSQSLQLDRQMAEVLISELQKAFHLS